MQKKNLQIIILHVLQLLKKDKKAKQKQEKKNKTRDCACKESN